MQFEVVPEFLAVYEGLAGRKLAAVHEMLAQLADAHESVWARQGRIRGERHAWIVLDGDWRLYWEYRDEETIVLLALIRRGCRISLTQPDAPFGLFAVGGGPMGPRAARSVRWSV